MNTRYSKLLLAFLLLVLFEHLPNICSMGNAKEPTDAGHPASYAEAVALVAKLQIQMKDALAAGDMKAADEPLHEIGHVLEEIPTLAGKQSLSAPDKEKIKKAVHVLFDVYGEIDEEVHSEDTVSYKPYAQKIESALGILQSFVTREQRTQEAERLAAEEELQRVKDEEKARLRETIRKKLEKDKPPSLPDLLQQVLPSVVVIKGDHGEGSGFVIGPDLICTNHHVIDGTGSAKISFNNAVTRNAQGTLYKSESMDIAILKVAIPTGIPVLELHPRDPRQGVEVFAIGHPGGSKNSVTDGIVSQVHTSDSFQKITKFRRTGTWIQTNAEINSGNSGGPLLNSRGVVVGMSTLGSNSQLGLVNINFATSASNITKALRLAKSGELSAFEANPKRKQKKEQTRERESKDDLRVNYYANGQKSAETHYKDGKRDGFAAEWYENGVKKREQYYKDGKEEGLETSWDANGQKKEEGHYKDGKKDGLWTAWYANGQKAGEGHYKNGKLVSASAWKPDGTPCPVTKVIDGSGIVVTYYENGQKSWETHYKNWEEVRNTRRHENGKKSISLQPVDRAGFDRVIAEHAGNVVLVDFWARWSLPCRQTFPHTVGLYDKLHDQGLAVVSLSMDQLQDKQKALEFLYQQGATFDNLISSYGPGVEGFHAFGIPDAIPYFTLYDRQGKLRYRFSPLFVDGKDGEPLEAIDARVGQLLSEK